MRLALFLFVGVLAMSHAQEIDQYLTYDAFEAVHIVNSDQVQVLNFWATWCAPCIKELPYFEKLNLNSDHEVVLVSIDFANQYEKRLIPYVKKKGFTSKIVHLADPKPNDWIDRVDPSWSGAIPATLIRYQGKSLFLEQEFINYEELQEAIQGFVQDVDAGN